jgi:hypothetical protein
MSLETNRNHFGPSSERVIPKGGGEVELKDWREVLTEDIPRSITVTPKTVEMAVSQGRRYRGSMRISTGRIWTNEDYEKRRAKILATPLP